VVIAEALSSNDAKLECAGGVTGQFRLSHMHELATDRGPLISFMFYNGALTYAPLPLLKQSLCIPNNVARDEVAMGLQKMLGVDQIRMENLPAPIADMVDNTQVDLFCQAQSRWFLLSCLRGGLGGKDPFAQGK